MNTPQESSKRSQGDFPFSKTLILIGFMGAGKTSAASCLAERFALQVIETDQEIVLREGMSIPEIFSAHGETYFRDRETEVFRDLKESGPVIVSAGGGAVLRDDNVKYMKANGVIVLLTASPAVSAPSTHKDSDVCRHEHQRLSFQGTVKQKEGTVILTVPSVFTGKYSAVPPVKFRLFSDHFNQKLKEN